MLRLRVLGLLRCLFALDSSPSLLARDVAYVFDGHVTLHVLVLEKLRQHSLSRATLVQYRAEEKLGVSVFGHLLKEILSR